MKNIFKIYVRDIKRMCTNWAAMIIAIIIILIPSLYSLTNIKASWDPYANTGGIKIAVVNNDAGTIYKDQDLNIGEELVEELEDNDKMNWIFVSEEEASYGLINEKYYASIVIPEDFSKCVTTLMDKKVVKPKLIYTVNEKTNAIAPKLTDAGVKSVKNQLDDNIIKTVSGVMFRLVNETGVEIDGKRDSIRDVINKIYELDEELPELESLLDDTINGVSDVNKLILKTNDIIPTISEVLDYTNDFVDNSGYIIGKMKSDVDEISPKIKENLLLSQQLIDNAKVTLDNLDENVLPDTAKKSLIQMSEIASSTKTTISEVNGMLKNTKLFLKKIIDYDFPEINIDNFILEQDENLQEIQKQFNEQKQFFDDIKDSLKSINRSINVFMDKLSNVEEKLNIIIARANEKIEELDNGEGLDLQTLTDLRSNINDINTLVSDVLDSYDSEIINGIDDGFNSIRYILNVILDILNQGRDILPDLEDILTSSQDSMNFCQDSLSDIRDKFPEVKDKVHKIADKLREMDEDDKFNDILDMITNNWDEQSDFMANIVEIEDNRLFSWPNYGSSSVPFYIVLCIWVGALISSALLSFKTDNLEDGVELKPYEVYLGKLLTFLTLTSMGSAVACLGALLWLDVYVVHPFMFVLFGIFISIVFTLVIYTAASLLDDIGKAVIVIIMVIQMAGTSGTFPIEVTPEIFHSIYEYLPFTYAINGMRQILAGIVYPILLRDIKILSIYAALSLILGITLKNPLNKIIGKIMEKLELSRILRH